MIPLLLIRHSETTWNAEKRLQGRHDTPLSERGCAMVQAWAVPEEYASFTWVSSPLQRAVETARLLGQEPEIEPALIEMSWGDWEGEHWQSLQQRLGKDGMAVHKANSVDFRPPNGESPRDVQARLRPWLKSLKTPTVAVCHKGVMQALYSLATGWTMAEKAPVKFKHGFAFLFSIREGVPHAQKTGIPLTAC